MGLIFYYGSDKTRDVSTNSISKGRNIKRLTPVNRKFLQSLGYKVIDNGDVEYIKRYK